MASGGVLTYAAEGALPGDVLYPVKLSVNESVIELLQRTPQKKAQWAARRQERRLTEARRLVETVSVKQATEEPVPAAAVRMNRSEPAPIPERDQGMTEKQATVLDELMHAGVSDAKIKLWVKALRGNNLPVSLQSIGIQQKQ